MSRYLRGGRRYHRAQRVEGPCASAMGKQHEEPAGDRQILLEVEELVAVCKVHMEHYRRDDTEDRQRQSGTAGLPADGEEQPPTQLDGDRGRQIGRASCRERV